VNNVEEEGEVEVVVGGDSDAWWALRVILNL
jgi:hypothetical protein